MLVGTRRRSFSTGEERLCEHARLHGSAVVATPLQGLRKEAEENCHREAEDRKGNQGFKQREAGCTI